MTDKDKAKLVSTEKRKADQETEPTKDLKKVSVKIEQKRCEKYRELFMNLFYINENNKKLRNYENSCEIY